MRQQVGAWSACSAQAALDAYPLTLVCCIHPGLKRRADQMSSQSQGKVRASHLLVKHRDSRRPSSWKEPTVTRSKVVSPVPLYFLNHCSCLISGWSLISVCRKRPWQ